MKRITETTKIELENMVDAYGLPAVLAMLSEIASEKADHVRVNWQDDVTARGWDKAADRIGVTARVAADYVG